MNRWPAVLLFRMVARSHECQAALRELLLQEPEEEQEEDQEQEGLGESYPSRDHHRVEEEEEGVPPSLQPKGVSQHGRCQEHQHQAPRDHRRQGSEETALHLPPSGRDRLRNAGPSCCYRGPGRRQRRRLSR